MYILNGTPIGAHLISYLWCSCPFDYLVCREKMIFSQDIDYVLVLDSYLKCFQVFLKKSGSPTAHPIAQCVSSLLWPFLILTKSYSKAYVELR